MPVEETEIERIQRELDILRTRQSLMLKWNRVALVVCAAMIVPFMIFVVLNIHDPLFALFIVVMIIIVGALSWIGGKVLLQVAPDYRPDIGPFGVGPRNVPIVRYQIRRAGFVPLYKKYLHPYSQIDELREMISWREQRLQDLKRGDTNEPS